MVGVGWRVWGMVPPGPTHPGGGGVESAGAGDPPTGPAAAPFVPLPAPQVADGGPGAIDPAKNRRVSEAIGRARASTVAVEYETGTRRHVTSGVVINDQGEILSIRVDPPADRTRPSIIARDATGRRHPARWLAVDPDTGLTLLRVEGAKLKPIRQAAGDPSLGAEIFLIGTPYGLGHSVSRGHIAGLGRRLTLGPQTLSGLIQIQATLHPGDNGALLADLDGGWLGLVRGTLAALGANAGRENDLGFAIPTRDALWIADRLRATGKVDRAYFGLRFAPGPEEEPGFAPPLAPPADPPAAGLAEDEVGARVTDVVTGSPADRSGIRQGDRVIRVDDRLVNTSNDLTERLDRTGSGTELTFEYVRGTTKERVLIRGSSRPAAEPVGPELVPPVSWSPNRPNPTATPAPSPPAESPSTIIRALRDRLDQLEKRVELLERANRDRKSVSN